MVIKSVGIMVAHAAEAQGFKGAMVLTGTYTHFPSALQFFVDFSFSLLRGKIFDEKNFAIVTRQQPKFIALTNKNEESASLIFVLFLGFNR